MSKESLNEARREFARHGRNARVYISGPMTGLERREYLRNFYQAEEWLRWAGFRKIMNPTKLAPCRWPWLYRLIGYRLTLAYDLWHLRRCTHIYMMAGWQYSRGARLERMKAREWRIEEMK